MLVLQSALKSTAWYKLHVLGISTIKVTLNGLSSAAKAQVFAKKRDAQSLRARQRLSITLLSQAEM